MSPGKITSDHFDPVEVVPLLESFRRKVITSAWTSWAKRPRRADIAWNVPWVWRCGFSWKLHECIMSVTFLDLNAFCQNRLTLILAILLSYVIINYNSIDSSMDFNCFRVRSHIKKTTDQRGSACASGAGSAKVLEIKETPGSSAWGAAKCGIAVPRKLYGGVELCDGTRWFEWFGAHILLMNFIYRCHDAGSCEFM